MRLPMQGKGINRIILVPAQGGWVAQVKVYEEVDGAQGRRICKTRTLVQPDLKTMFNAVAKHARDLGLNTDIETLESAW